MRSKPSRSNTLQYTTPLEPPRATGFSLADTTTTSSPASAAVLATTNPDVPAPTTTTSASTVSTI